jgi:hypothetical protein
MEMDVTVKGFKGVGWIHQAWDRVQWQALMNMVLNIYIL